MRFIFSQRGGYDHVPSTIKLADIYGKKSHKLIFGKRSSNVIFFVLQFLLRYFRCFFQILNKWVISLQWCLQENIWYYLFFQNSLMKQFATDWFSDAHLMRHIELVRTSLNHITVQLAHIFCYINHI
jgi:hypothetical protein